MEANFTKYIVSKLNALGICNEELDIDSLENILEVSIQCQKGLDQIFQTAAKSGNFPLCKYMLKNMENLNPADEEKATAFHYAAENGHWEICCLIIKYLKHKNPGDVRGFTPLHLAAKNGHLPLVNYLISRGLAGHENASLCCACKGGHLRVAQRLLDAGADPNRVFGGKSPLQHALLAKHVNEFIGSLLLVNENDNHGHEEVLMHLHYEVELIIFMVKPNSRLLHTL